MKYTFDILRDSGLDPLTSLFFEVQNATNILTYGLIFLFVGISFYAFIRKTQDIGKSGISAAHIGFILSIVMYYWGYAGDYFGLTGKKFLSEWFLFPYVIFYVILLIGLKFFRSSPS